MAKRGNATQAAVTLATRACTPIYRRAVTLVTLSEYRLPPYVAGAPTAMAHGVYTGSFY
jgi:hypothetical protein